MNDIIKEIRKTFDWLVHMSNEQYEKFDEDMNELERLVEIGDMVEKRLKKDGSLEIDGGYIHGDYKESLDILMRIYREEEGGTI